MARFCVQATWSDAPHLTEDQKARLYDSIPPYQRDARTKGVPKFWPRCYALDVGWNRTAAVWGAWDQDQDIVYLYSEYYRGQAEPAVHAQAILSRGKWIPGAIDPAARGRQQADGERLIDQYVELGLTIGAADNAVEAGIYEVWSRLSSQRLKVFRSLQNWLMEF